ncbi:MAG: erythromycin esterase family protein [Akkermansiaceae bacterium]|nr:erythromycin esterase family protein [Akkermansiaceae bacterium]
MIYKSSLLCFLLPVLGYAQEPQEPREPILSQAPGRAEWTVRITEQFPDGWATDNSWEAQGGGTAAASATRTIRSLTYAKDASLQTYQVTTRWTDGETEQEWIVMGQHIADRPGGGLYVVGAERLTASELKASDFPELVWIERKHFKGVRLYKGRRVFAFEEEFNRRRMTPTEARQYQFAQQADPKATPESVFKPRFPKVVAYLDVVTQLPVLYHDGTKLRTYSFKDPGGTRLRPPQAIIDFVRQRQAALDARITPPAGPGKTQGASQ